MRCVRSGLVTIPRMLEFIHEHATHKFDVAALKDRAALYEVCRCCLCGE